MNALDDPHPDSHADGWDPDLDEGRVRIRIALIRTLYDEVFENGVDHPAEQIIEDALRSVEERRVLPWLREWAFDAECFGFSADLLRCLGRLDLGTSAWRAALVQSALASDDVEMRDAAVQAAESWGGSEFLDVLRNHAEPRPWLRTYVKDVVEGLGRREISAGRYTDSPSE